MADSPKTGADDRGAKSPSVSAPAPGSYGWANYGKGKRRYGYTWYARRLKGR